MSKNPSANIPHAGNSVQAQSNNSEMKKVYPHQLHKLWYQRRIRFMTLQGIVVGSLWSRATEFERCEWRVVAQHYDAVLKLEGAIEFKHEDIVKRMESEGWQPKVINADIERAEKDAAAMNIAGAHI